MSLTHSRVTQYIGILLILGALGGGYFYWQAKAGSTIVDRAISYNTLTSGSATTTDPATTASISPGANRLILAAVTSNSLQSPTLTGNGLTWVEIGASQDAARRTVLFRAMSAAPTTGAVTIDWASAPGEQRWVISEFDNVDTSGTNGSGAIAQSATNFLDLSTSFTITLAEFSAPGNATYGVVQAYTVDSNSVSSGSGFSGIVTHGTNFKQHAQYKLGNDTTVDWTNINNVYWRGIAVEIKKKGGTKLNTAIRDSLNEGLAGYWKMDDGSGATAVDSSANGNTATLMGPSWTTGQIGSAVNFDGVDDEINVATTTSLNLSTEITVSAWINPSVLGTHGGIAYKSDASWGLRTSASTLNLVINSTNHQSDTGSLTTGVWTHVVGTYDGANVKLYKNGTLIKTIAQTGAINSANGSFTIGGGGSTIYFTGPIDETRIYNRALSADEVTRLYKTTTPSNPDTRLKGYWSFDGDAVSGTTARDLSGSGNNGTLTNGPTITEGIRGQAMRFDGSGTNNYVNVPQSTSIDFGAAQDFTVATWVKTTQGSTLNVWPQIINKEDATVTRQGYGIYLHDSTIDARWGFYIYSAGTPYTAYGSSNIADGQWHFIVGVRNGSTIYSYQDGVLANTTSATNGSLTKNVPFNIGRNTVLGVQYYNGLLDEVRVYNAALTASEIWNLYQEGSVQVNKSQSNNGDSLNDGLAGYWKLDDASGVTATDSSGNAYNGTLTNGPTWTTGRIGGAVTFDGTDDVITAGNNLDIGTGDVTMAAWINAANANQCSTIMGKRVDSGGYAQYTFWAGHLDSSGVGVSSKKIACFMYDGSFVDNIHSQNYRTTDDILDGSWHHVVCRRKSGQSLAIFVDGVSRALTAVNPNTTSVNTSNAGPFVIGARNITGAASFTGAIDESRLYNRALSDDEIARLYKTTSPTNPETGLVGYWSFNGKDLSGTTAYDRSGKGNNGTLTSGPTITEGRIGQGLSFDGSDDYVSMPSLDFGSTFSVSLWMKPYADGNSSARGIINRAQVTCQTNGFSILTRVAGGSAGQIVVQTGDGSTCDTASTNTGMLTYGQWSHLLVTVDKTGGNAHIYLNGTDVTIDTSILTTFSSSGTWNIGKISTAFPGSIDEVRIYNRALSATEIASLYNYGR